MLYVLGLVRKASNAAWSIVKLGTYFAAIAWWQVTWGHSSWLDIVLSERRAPLEGPIVSPISLKTLLRRLPMWELLHEVEAHYFYANSACFECVLLADDDWERRFGGKRSHSVGSDRAWLPSTSNLMFTSIWKWSTRSQDLRNYLAQWRNGHRKRWGFPLLWFK